MRFLDLGILLVIHRKLTKSKVMPLIESALKDESDYVRGHANSAAADVEWFLKWRITKTKVGEPMNIRIKSLLVLVPVALFLRRRCKLFLGKTCENRIKL